MRLRILTTTYDHLLRSFRNRRLLARLEASDSDHDIRAPVSKFWGPVVADETSDSDHDIRPPASKRRCAQEEQIQYGSFAEGKETSPEVADEPSDSDHDIRAPASKRQYLQKE